MRKPNQPKVILDHAGCWPDLKLLKAEGRLIHLGQGTDIQVVRVPEGMASGRSSVIVRLELEDGRVVLAETTMRLFLSCAEIFAEAERRDQT